MDLAAELQKIYDSEINIRINWLWDCGIDVRLGDQMNGFLAEETSADAAANRDPEVRAAAAQRLFRPPSTGARPLSALRRAHAAPWRN